jgi:hypothetical protein
VFLLQPVIFCNFFIKEKVRKKLKNYRLSNTKSLPGLTNVALQLKQHFIVMPFGKGQELRSNHESVMCITNFMKEIFVQCTMPYSVWIF